MANTPKLKTFKEFVEQINEANLIMEAKLDDLKSSIGAISTEHDPNGEHKTPSDIIDHFHKHNPTGDISHTRWAVDQYHKGNMKQEDAPSMKDTFADFNRHKDKLPKKKIEQYKSVSDLRDAIRPHKGTTKAELGLTKSTETVQKGADLVHNEGGVKLYHVHTKEASKELGKGMPWCTSHRDDNRNMFDHYNSKSGGKFFIAHLPHEQAPHRKLGIGVGTGEFQDENNKRMSHEDLKALVDRNPSLKKIPHLQGVRGATTEDHNKHFDKLAKNDDENIQHAGISHKTISKALNHPDEEVRAAAIKHPNVTSKHIDEALNNKDEYLRKEAIRHPNVTSKHIDKALDDVAQYVRKAAISHPNATSQHIDKALDDKDELVRAAAIRHPNATTQHIDKALDDKDEYVRSAAIRHPNATSQHIDKALDDKDEYVRDSAIQHPKATSQHIDKALDDKNASVRETATQHPNATSHHIDKALDDKFGFVRATAIQHPKATSQHIDKALSDRNSAVRRSAIQHPNATLQHIDKALNDEEDDISSKAKKHPKYIARQYEQAVTKLKTFKEFVEQINEANLIMEAKLDDLKSSIGTISTEHDSNGEHKTPSDIIDHFHKHNPTGDISHTRWAVDQYHKGNMKQEDAPSMKDTFADFNRHKDKLQKKKIEQYKSISDLRDAIRPHKGTTKAELGLTKSTETVQKGATLVHDQDGVKLYHVHTKEASKELGKGMPWCTSHRGDNRNMFNHYNKSTGKKFFIAHLPHEQAPHRKLGIGIGAEEFQDENNKRMEHEDLKALVDRNPSLGKIPHLQGARVATTEDHNKHFDNLAKNDNENIHHADLSHETISKALTHRDENVRAAAIRHPNATTHHIDKALDDKNDSVRSAAIYHSNATSHHIDKALDDKFGYIRTTAIQHPKATSQHIDKALDDKDELVRAAAIRHPNATSQHIDKALDDKFAYVRQTAISHPNATSQHIDKALDDKDEYVRAAAIRHPNATTQHIDKALDDKFGYIRTTAIQHPKATSQHIDKALDDKNEGVRRTAIRHPNATSQHIDKALDDEDSGVRRTAIEHPKATSHHIDKALSDRNSAVRRSAIQNPNATLQHIDKALNDEEESISSEAKKHPKYIARQYKQTIAKLKGIAK